MEIPRETPEILDNMKRFQLSSLREEENLTIETIHGHIFHISIMRSTEAHNIATRSINEKILQQIVTDDTRFNAKFANAVATTREFEKGKIAIVIERHEGVIALMDLDHQGNKTLEIGQSFSFSNDGDIKLQTAKIKSIKIDRHPNAA